MPFTVSHAAAALPLRRYRFFIFSALVAGSMAPDFEFFVFLSFTRRVSHTLPGILTFSLPAALIVLAVYHGLLKRPLLSLLPVGHRRRLAPYAGPFPWRAPSRLGRIVVSVLVGILGHVAWDGFTHVGAFGVEAFPALATPVVYFAADAIRVSDLLQVIFSILGLAIVFRAYVNWYRGEPGPPAHLLDHMPEGWQLLVLGTFCATAVVLGAGYGFSAPVLFDDVNSLRGFGGRVVSAGGAVVAAQAVAFSMAHIAMRRQREPSC